MLCLFCELDTTKLENTIIEETKFFRITPALGSIVEGYLLITSKRHVDAMSELNPEEMAEYKTILHKYRELFKRIYGKYPIIFEHGTANLKSTMKASSVSHAHTHIVNHNYINEDEIIKAQNFVEQKGMERISSTKDNYIFYLSPKGRCYISENFEGTSQLMRIYIAEDLGIKDKYNWKTNHFMSNIEATVNQLKKEL